ncbi:tetratricopeptide repeat protein [Nocardiopsis dassonvillei]|uniref:tetratricopeptide repeat protein n=1 Tax=Nocardiopsis dassonvillei TaxID=2014 RepID=UPI0036FD6190
MDSPGHTSPTNDPSARTNTVRGDISGTAVQVGSLRGDVNLHLASAADRVPRQLPATPAVFVDRPHPMRALEAAVSRAHARGRHALVVITGSAGVGKSALAAEFLRAHPELGGGGQLFVDLHGFSPGPPADPHDVLDVLLRAVGVQIGTAPADLATRAAWWRSATAHAPVSLLLDDALSAAQVRALLPGGDRGTVVVTTRLRLAGLRLDGGQFVDLHPMTGAEGVALLSELSGRSPAGEADQKAMHGVVTLCSALPVAVCTVAVDHGTRSRTWRDTERRLRSAPRRLDHLDTASREMGMDVSVRNAFDLSYASLPVFPALLYRRLAWHPGPDVTGELAAHLTGRPAAECEAGLAALTRHHLLTEHSAERFSFHDLLRLHAAEKAEAEEDSGARHRSLTRLVSGFADLAVSADAVLRPYAGNRAVPGSPFTDAAQATAWLNRERDNLAALAELAPQLGAHEHVPRLLDGLWSLFLHHGQARLWLRAAAPVLGEPSADLEETTVARLLNNRALVHSHLAGVEEAMADLDAAERVWRRHQDLERLAQTQQRRGIVAFQNHLPGQAADHLALAVATDERTGVTHNLAISLFMLGRARHALGDLGPARLALERALPLLDGDAYNQARTRIVLGTVLAAMEEFASASAELDRALEVMRERGSASGQGKALEAIGELAERRGEPGRAREAYERAVELLLPTDPARLRVEERLEALG